MFTSWLINQNLPLIRAQHFIFTDPNSRRNGDKTFRVSEVIEHPKYDTIPMPEQFDFAILKLADPVSDLTFFVCLPEGQHSIAQHSMDQNCVS